MNLHDILLKNYRSHDLDSILSAPVTRRHYIDGRPGGNEKMGDGLVCESASPKAKRIKRIMCQFLKDHPGATAHEIASHMRTTVKRLGNYTKRLCDAGVLRYEIGRAPREGGRQKFHYYVQEGA